MTNYVKNIVTALVNDIRRDAKSNAERVERNAEALTAIAGAEMIESFGKAWKASGYPAALAMPEHKAIKTAINDIVNGVQEGCKKAGVIGEPWKGTRNQLRVALGSLCGLDRDASLSAFKPVTVAPVATTQTTLVKAGTEAAKVAARDNADAPILSADKVESASVAGVAISPALAAYRSALNDLLRFIKNKGLEPKTAADMRTIENAMTLLAAH